MNDTIKTLVSRRSIRSYKKEQIKDSELQQILEAGTYAATGMGMQSPVIIAVQDAETIKVLSKLNASVMGTDQDPFYGAPTVVIVLADKDRPTHIEDGSLVIGNMMNAAASLSVASCWIHRAREVFEMPEGRELLTKWGIKGNLTGIGHCILGYANGEIPEAKPRKTDYIHIIK